MTELLEQFFLLQHFLICQLELLDLLITLRKVENIVIATDGNVNGNKKEMSKRRMTRG